MPHSTITKSAFFATTPETLWAYLTEADKLGEWYHPARQDLEANKDYELYNSDNDEKWIWGSVLEWNPPKKLVYTFIIPPLETISSTVTWVLEEAHGGTKLTLTHEGIEELGDSALGLLMALDDGWDEHIGKLRKAFKDYT
jgi:uncharacterized protein YndB with AHSA1/START domain